MILTTQLPKNIKKELLNESKRIGKIILDLMKEQKMGLPFSVDRLCAAPDILLLTCSRFRFQQEIKLTEKTFVMLDSHWNKYQNSHDEIMASIGAGIIASIYKYLARNKIEIDGFEIIHQSTGLYFRSK